jgi:hypothetical protein
MMITWLIMPIYRLSRFEYAIVLSIIACYRAFGMLSALGEFICIEIPTTLFAERFSLLGIGSMLSVMLFAIKFHQVSLLFSCESALCKYELLLP